MTDGLFFSVWVVQKTVTSYTCWWNFYCFYVVCDEISYRHRLHRQSVAVFNFRAHATLVFHFLLLVRHRYLEFNKDALFINENYFRKVRRWKQLNLSWKVNEKTHPLRETPFSNEFLISETLYAKLDRYKLTGSKP